MKRLARLGVARGTRRRKRTAEPPPHGLQPLARDPGPQKLKAVHGPREVVPQKLDPEFPPRAPVPPVHGVVPPALDPEFRPRDLARRVHGVEFLRRGVEFQRLGPEFLRLERGGTAIGSTDPPFSAGFFENLNHFRRGQTARWPRLSFLAC